MKHIFIIVTMILNTLFIISCNTNNEISDPIPVYDDEPYILNAGNFPPPKLPQDNMLTIQKVKLGRMLFYEKKLSGDLTQACASCHRQESAFTDTARLSIGIRGLEGKRQAMPIFNIAWHTNEFFWDGRAHLLRDQSLKPIQDELEMDETLENVVSKLKSSKIYRDQFIRAFGSDEINPEKISLALEQFMLTIISMNSKYDRFFSGTEQLNESELRGKDLFFNEYNPSFPEISGAGCAHCHTGINFENDQYMNNGLDDDSGIKDNGREKVTGKQSDLAKFKVPSLRNVELTFPYMHDGRFKTLEEVVNHYNSGLKSSTTLDPALEYTKAKGLMLSERDIQDLTAFLRTLTDPQLINNSEYKSPF